MGTPTDRPTNRPTHRPTGGPQKIDKNNKNTQNPSTTPTYMSTQYIHKIPKCYNAPKQDQIQKLLTRAVNELEINKLPEEVIISTMTIVCNIDTTFLCGNIARYIDLSTSGVQSVTHGRAGDAETNRSILPKKIGHGKKKKKKNIFFNQVSIYVSVKGKKKPVNVKLFSNGAIQMTGCKTIEDAVEAINKILPELQIIKAIINYDTLKIEDKPFATDTTILEPKNVKNFRIAMINSNFKIDFYVDRSKLYNLLLEEKYDCYYEPIKHACVNIKYNHPDKIISIFVFERGAIIVTGARNCSQILDGYMFINKYLLKHHKQILKHDGLTNSNIIKYLQPGNSEETDDSDDMDDISDDDDINILDSECVQPASIGNFGYYK